MSCMTYKPSYSFKTKSLHLDGGAAAVERFWLQGEVIRLAARLSPLTQLSPEGFQPVEWLQGMSLHVWGEKIKKIRDFFFDNCGKSGQRRLAPTIAVD